MPNKYIFHPWTAPEGIQKAANCVIGKDYPEPVADYIERRKICLQRLKAVCYQIKTTTISTIST
jgi:cryptochrome